MGTVQLPLWLSVQNLEQVNSLEHLAVPIPQSAVLSPQPLNNVSWVRVVGVGNLNGKDSTAHGVRVLTDLPQHSTLDSYQYHGVRLAVIGGDHHGRLEAVPDCQGLATRGFSHQQTASSSTAAVLDIDQGATAITCASTGLVPESVEQIRMNRQCQETNNTGSSNLNPDISPFKVRNPNLLHRGVLVPDLDADWEHVQRVALGGVGDDVVIDSGP